MLRNLNKSSAGRRILGSPFVGLIASQIISETATGDSGPGLLYDEALANTGKQLRLHITSSPSSGVLFVYENGALDLTGAADGSYSIGYQYYLDNVLAGSDTATVTVGPVNASAGGGTGTSTGSGTGGAATGTTSATAGGGTGAGTGSGSGGAATGAAGGSASAAGGTGAGTGSGSGGSALGVTTDGHAGAGTGTGAGSGSGGGVSAASSVLELTLVSMATPILAGGLHPNVAPQNGTQPYGVYIEVASLTNNTLSDGVSIQQSVFQIDVWDVTYAGAKTVGEALSSAIQAAFAVGTLEGVQRSRRSRYDPVTKLHGFTYEYSFWYH